MSRGSGLIAGFATCAVAVATTFAAPHPSLQPGQPARTSEKSSAPSEQPPAPSPDRLRERLAATLNDLRADQAKLEEAIKKLDSGASLDDVRDGLPDHLGLRSRPGPDMRRDRDNVRPDRPDRGDRGSDRGGPPGGRADQPFSHDDWEAVHAIITHARPEMLDRFQELRQKDPAAAQRLTLAAYPRLRPLLDLYRHDRPAFDLRLEEMAIIRDSLPLAKAVIELREQGKAEDSAEMKSAREKLRDLARRHAETRLAIQRSELESLRKRVERRETEIAEQAADPQLAIERSIDGLIKQAARGDTGPERRRPGSRPDDRDIDSPPRTRSDD